MKKIQIFTLASMLLVSSNGMADGKRLRVNCDNAESLARVVEKARANTVIEVSGVCYEALHIRQDGLQLVGKQAVLSGELMEHKADLLTVSGAQRISVSGFVIRAGGTGVVIDRGASVQLSDVKVEQNQSLGISVLDNSHLGLEHIVVTQNQSNGIDVQQSSSVKITGSLVISLNAGFGLNVMGASSVLSQDAQMDISENRAMGLHAVTGSNIFFNDSELQARRNLLRGVSVNSAASLFAFNTHMTATDSVLLDGFAFANCIVDLDKDSAIHSHRNGRDGLVLEGATLTSFVFITPVGPQINISHNRANGVRAVLGSKLELKANSTFRSEQNALAGLFLDDGSAANLRNATLQGNQVDMRLSFASRVNSVAGNQIDLIECDTHSFIKGEHRCP